MYVPLAGIPNEACDRSTTNPSIIDMRSPESYGHTITKVAIVCFESIEAYATVHITSQRGLRRLLWELQYFSSGNCGSLQCYENEALMLEHDVKPRST